MGCAGSSSSGVAPAELYASEELFVAPTEFYDSYLGDLPYGLPSPQECKRLRMTGADVMSMHDAFTQFVKAPGKCTQQWPKPCNCANTCAPFGSGFALLL